METATETPRPRLSLPYQRMARVDFAEVLRRTKPSAEVPGRGTCEETHRPLDYPGRFGSDYRR